MGTTPTDRTQTLTYELEQMEGELAGIVENLPPWLGAFIRQEIEGRKRTHPGAVVLAAALPVTDTSEAVTQRVSLAAALELLQIALDIHRLLLLSSSAAGSVDKSLLGGTVLAGDYCFSRAAALAARTGHPRVVAIFAELLKELSEGNLRQVFDELDAPYDEVSLLQHRGAQAGAVLAGLSAEAQKAIGAFAGRLPTVIVGWKNLAAHDGSIRHTLREAGIPPHQQRRWRSVIEMLA